MEHFRASQTALSTPPLATPAASIRSRKLDSVVGETTGNYSQDKYFDTSPNVQGSTCKSTSTALQKFAAHRGVREAMAK
jgi:hypothetical protein